MNRRMYTAAGGVVRDAAGRVLLITRVVLRDGAPTLEVRLPKGHVEPGETDAQAALREVCEETGYCSLEILDDLGTTVSEFERNGEHVRRTEHYFLMRLTGAERGAPRPDSPEAEEALFQPQWSADLARAADALTFPSERLFVQRARERHNAGA